MKESATITDGPFRKVNPETKIITLFLAPGEQLMDMTLGDKWLVMQAKFWAWFLGWKVEVKTQCEDE